METQVFSKSFAGFKQNHKSNSLLKISKDYLQYTEKKPLVITICYNSFLEKMGFHVSTASRKLLDKALNAVYNLSFTAVSGKTSDVLQERLIYRLVTFHKNKKKYAKVFISSESFFLYYSTTILGLHCYVCALFCNRLKNNSHYMCRILRLLYFFM